MRQVSPAENPGDALEKRARRAAAVKRWMMVALVAAAAAGVYLPTLGAGFVYDDVAQIQIDDYIHQPANLREVLSLRVLGRDVMDGNRPVMLLSLMADSMLWGSNAFGYHLTNLLLHVLCSVLLLLVLVRIFGRLSSTRGWRPPVAKGRRAARPGICPPSPWLAATVGAMLFAIHPIGSEAVCVITFREDLLVTFFALAALLMADGFPAKRRLTSVLLGGACLASMLAAVACKESGAAVVVFLAAYWLTVRRAARWRAWVGLIGAGLVVVAAFLAARFALAPQQSVIFTSKPVYPGGSFWAMLAVQPRIWAFQLSQIVWPSQLGPHQFAYTISQVSLGAALAGLAAVALVTAALARRNAGVLLGAAFYWLAILPVSNLVPIFQPLADRYLYLPMVGVSLAAGAVVYRWKISSKKSRLAPAMIVVAAILGVALGAATVRRTFVWRDGRSLWTDAVGKNPYSSAMYSGLGFALFHDGELDEAAMSFGRACELNRNNADPLGGLAITYEAMQKPRQAELVLREAVARDRRYTNPLSLVEALILTPDEARKLQAIAERIFIKRPAERVIPGQTDR